jgi:hypothetical protein
MQLKFLMGTTFKDVFDGWSNHFRWNDKQHVLVFEAEDVKWYESFHDVARFTEFLGEVRDLEYVTEFVRVGEEEGDIESDYSCDSEYILSTNTYITCDV